MKLQVKKGLSHERALTPLLLPPFPVRSVSNVRSADTSAPPLAKKPAPSATGGEWELPRACRLRDGPKITPGSHFLPPSLLPPSAGPPPPAAGLLDRDECQTILDAGVKRILEDLEVLEGVNAYLRTQLDIAKQAQDAGSLPGVIVAAFLRGAVEAIACAGGAEEAGLGNISAAVRDFSPFLHPSTGDIVAAALNQHATKYGIVVGRSAPLGNNANIDEGGSTAQAYAAIKAGAKAALAEESAAAAAAAAAAAGGEAHELVLLFFNLDLLYASTITDVGNGGSRTPPPKAKDKRLAGIFIGLLLTLLRRLGLEASRPCLSSALDSTPLFAALARFPGGPLTGHERYERCRDLKVLLALNKKLDEEAAAR